ncbi:hypothetical protein LguiB_019660 [Lonicera macranthoides]
MGCISSKQARTNSPSYHLPKVKKSRSKNQKISRKNNNNNASSRNLDSIPLQSKGGGGGVAASTVGSTLEKIKEEPEKEKDAESSSREIVVDSKNSKSFKKEHHRSEKKSVFSIKLGRLTEAEHVAAGWPAWLTTVAGEAIEGWLPLRSDNFERLEKGKKCFNRFQLLDLVEPVMIMIGQGTYSSVYRARDVETGKMVALKKVKFDNFQPESVRFMAREIAILRRLDHQNIMKLEGLIASRLSCSIYFVFEYMEHDLSGLLSCPDIKFTDSQIKCYMKQLLSGLEHCHSQGVLHRDIKTSNILVNNEGILKIADFGLANFVSHRNKEPLTSRVVTLWYRPPELLLGSTSYGASVDMWSVGCVFAELFIGRPILKGRTEVEQLHKIFKLCGSPPDDFWKKSKLPLASMFKPSHPYESTLRERCKEFPKFAVSLLETFLSIETYKRGTASSALESEYFNTKPYACDPSSFPRYPPNKEIDAKFREEARRKKASARIQATGTSRNPRKVRKTLQESSSFFKVVPTEEVDANSKVARRNNGGNSHIPRGKGVTEHRGSFKSSYDTVSEASQGTGLSQGTSIQSVPALTASSGFTWAKNRKPSHVSSRLHSQANSRSHLKGVEPTPELNRRDSLKFEDQESEVPSSRVGAASSGRDDIGKHAIQRKRRAKRNDSFDSADLFQAPEFLADYNCQEESVRLSGMLSTRIDGKQESHTCRHARRSSFSKGGMIQLSSQMKVVVMNRNGSARTSKSSEKNDNNTSFVAKTFWAPRGGAFNCCILLKSPAEVFALTL